MLTTLLSLRKRYATLLSIKGIRKNASLSMLYADLVLPSYITIKSPVGLHIHGGRIKDV